MTSVIQSNNFYKERVFFMPNLVWFRRDLRVQDNPALFDACENVDEGVIALFILTPVTWKDHAVAPIQIDFLIKNLLSLSEALTQLNIPLLVREVSSFKEIPDLLKKIIETLQIDALYFNRQYEWDERQRDEKVLQAVKCKVFSFDDQVVIPPEKILTQQDEPFKVFTPFKRKWLTLAENFYRSPLPKPKAQKKLTVLSEKIPENFSTALQLPKTGEQAAIQILRNFCQEKIFSYQKARDFPALNGTSKLSPYLAIGVLSPRQCIARVMLEKQTGSFLDFSGKDGASIWVSELIWREFYKMILFHFPKVSRNQPFQIITKKIPWQNNKLLFQKWCEGMTGFPLVDAAMRQLNQTGWMHNRLRMLTAMFLTKNLMIDWRWGERYFSEHLIDSDLSANNGGWQWSASTGTDAVPYFRIFNPITQSQRFDENGDFIRQFCPELSHLNAKMIHDPHAFNVQVTYPEKIIDYAKSRLRVLEVFKNLVKF